MCAPRTSSARPLRSCLLDRPLNQPGQHRVDHPEVERHDDDADDHDHRRRLRLLAVRPVHLLELGPALLEELAGARDRLLERFESLHGIGTRVRQDSNLQPPDLESGALAVRATDPASRDRRPATGSGARGGGRAWVGSQGAKRPSTGRAPSSISGRRESNPRPRAWKARALPPELLPRFMIWFVLRIAKWRGEDSNLRRHSPADLQSAPFGHSGTSPHRFRRAAWSRWSESNRRPADYKSAALPLSYIGGPHQPSSAHRHPRLSRATSSAAFRAVRDPDGSAGEHVPLPQ